MCPDNCTDNVTASSRSLSSPQRQSRAQLGDGFQSLRHAAEVRTRSSVELPGAWYNDYAVVRRRVSDIISIIKPHDRIRETGGFSLELNFRISRRPLHILLVPAKPELGRVGFVATLGGAVEDWVVPHQELQPTGRGGVGVVHSAVVTDEGAEARALGQITDNIRSRR